MSASNSNAAESKAKDVSFQISFELKVSRDDDCGKNAYPYEPPLSSKISNFSFKQFQTA